MQKKLIITAGAWAGQLIPQLNTPLIVTRQVILWVKPVDPAHFVPDKFPCWLLAGENTKGAWYGFPYLSGKEFTGPEGLKFALHYPAEVTDPGTVNREVSGEEIEKIIEVAKKHFLPAASEIVAAKTCLYTNSVDEDFIVDHLPGYGGDVTIACGFSGHGFKFVSVVGEILADLAMKGHTELPVGFLGLKRFSDH